MTEEPHDKSAQAPEVHEPVERRIEARAHRIWLADGRPEGHALDHWLRAKWELGEEDVAAERERLRKEFSPPDGSD